MNGGADRGVRRMLAHARRFALVPLALLSALCWAAAPAVKIGVLAYRPKEETRAQWQPTADYLSRMAGRRQFVIEPFHYEELEQAIASQGVDFVLINPSYYVLILKQNGLSPIATLVVRDGDHPVTALGGTILVRAERGDITGLADLRGKTIATPGTHSLAGYQAQAFEALQFGVDPGRDAHLLITSLPQDSTVQALLDGRADVAFVRGGLLEALVRERRLDAARVRVLAPQKLPSFPFAVSTRLYPEWPLAALPHVSDDLARQVAGALYTLPPHHPAARRGGYYGWTIPADYEPVRSLLETLRLPPFDQAPNFTAADIARRYWLEFVTFGVLLATLTVLLARTTLLNRRLASERRKSAAQAAHLQESEARLRLALQGADLGLWDWSVPDGTLDLNERWMRMLGYAPHEIRPQVGAWTELIHPDDLPVVQAALERHFRGEAEQYETEHRLRHKDGHWVWVLDRGRVLERAPDGTPLRAAGTHLDISARHLLEEELKALATTDPLTGLPNRRRFFEQLGQELARLRRLDKLPSSLLMADLDHFKQINDSHGHAVGDRVLRAFAEVLRASLREVDSAGRLGGEEFAILLPGTSLDQARVLAERLRERIAAAPLSIGEGRTLRYTASIGATELLETDAEPDAPLARADAALYRAKSGGRDRVETTPG